MDVVARIATGSRSGHRFGARATAAFFVALLVGSLAAPAGAREVPGFTIKLKGSKRVSVSHVGPERGRQIFETGDWTLKDCRTVEYCDVVPVTFDNGGKANGHRTTIGAYYPVVSGDYELRLYQIRFTRNEDTGQVEETSPQIAGLRFQENRDNVLYFAATVPDLDPGDYAVGIHCRGADCESASYTVWGQSTLDSVYTPPGCTRTDAGVLRCGGSTKTFVPPPPAPTTDPATEEDDEPGIDPPKPPEQPGDSGPARLQTIDGLAAGQQASPPSTRATTVTNLILLSLLLVVLSVGGTIVTMKIRRDLRA